MDLRWCQVREGIRGRPLQILKSIKDLACTSAKYKSCESMSDNVIRWISGKNIFTRVDETTQLGTRRMGLTHRVEFIDEELTKVLGDHEVCHYALKVMHRPEGDTEVHEKCIREMMVFPESHPTIISPIGLSKDKKDWNETKMKADSGRNNENKSLTHVIRRSLVFVGIGDLRKAQSFEEARNDFDPYHVNDPKPWPWIAPKLNPKTMKLDEQGNKYMTKYSEEADIYMLLNG
ncbi:hypothetical protein R1sor_021753 [Riccia sorocarpa]|uniref:Uncharacterized protein n=1 Tax=Riccia sorocarpa TaxID=122646 RepID=A0ABD3GHX3_9MARC